MRLGARAERAFPSEPVWYLEVMGIAPKAQGCGLGSRLLEPALTRADKEQLPCYLETPVSENIGFYERFGFVVERKLQFLPTGGPMHWTMRRPPQ